MVALIDAEAPKPGLGGAYQKKQPVAEHGSRLTSAGQQVRKNRWLSADMSSI
jgi:hypothetical protein